MLARRFDGGDDRIFAYDAELQQWRHIPDWPTFQALGFYWCNVTAADAGFFDRITIGPPYPATSEPELETTTPIALQVKFLPFLESE